MTTQPEITKAEFDARVLKIRGGKPIPAHLAAYAAELHQKGETPLRAFPKISWRELGLHLSKGAPL